MGHMQTGLLLLLLIAFATSTQVGHSKSSRHVQSRRVKFLKSALNKNALHQKAPGVAPPIPNQTYDSSFTKASDDDKVLVSGFDAPVEVIKLLTQFDENSDTIYDEDRCGAAVAIAAAINAGTFVDLVNQASTHVYDAQTLADYDRIKAAWEDKSITWKDMGIFMDHVFEGFSIPAPNANYARNGMPGAYLYDLLTKGAMLTPPSDEQVQKRAEDVFSPKQSWAYLIHFPDSTFAHWILRGKGALKSFIYDPYPMSNHLPLFEQGTPDFTVYNNWIKNSASAGSGWCVRTVEARDADLARAEQEAKA
jgi:hypothetical protein